MLLIRVLLAMPVAARNAVGQWLAGADDIEIIGAVADPVEILLAAGRLRADVVLTMPEGNEVPGFVSHLLTEYPQLKVLGITADGQSALLWDLQPRLVRLGEISPNGLPHIIRSAMCSEAPE